MNETFFENRAVYKTWKKYWTDGQYGACALHAGYPNLQTHAHDT